MKKLIISLSFLFLTDCVTNPQRAGRTTDIGVWQGKVLLANTKTNHKKWANVTWASQSDKQRMRIDVYAVMDIPVATFIKIGEESHLWLFTEKKYFFSSNGEKLFKHLTKMTLNPDVFYSLLGTPVPPSDDWQCKDQERVFKCHNQAEKMDLIVQHHDQDKRVINAHRGSKALRVRLLRSKVQVHDEHFKLLSTSHYKTIKI